MSLNEADTRVLLIEPRLQAAGWRGTRVTREHYYRRDQAYTAGRIYLRGDRARRGEPRSVDYLQYGSKECFNDFSRVFLHLVDHAALRRVDFDLLAGDLFEKRTIDPLALSFARDRKANDS